MVVVEIGRNSARKVLYNVRGVVGRDVFSVLHLYKNTLDCYKQEGEPSLPASVFLYKY